MLVMIDNFDSFTYNLYQYLMQLGAEVRVARNNSLTVEELEALAPRGLIISPGPGRPEGAGITVPAIDRFSGRIPILGVCLGHQAIALAFGGRVVSAQRLMHGKTSNVTAAPSRPCAITPWPWRASRCRPALRSAPNPTMGRSWASATAATPPRGCSSTPNPS